MRARLLHRAFRARRWVACLPVNLLACYCGLGALLLAGNYALCVAAAEPGSVLQLHFLLLKHSCQPFLPFALQASTARLASRHSCTAWRWLALWQS